MRSPLTALCAALLALALTAPVAGAQSSDGDVPTSGPIDFLLGLKREEGALGRFARQVSDPASAHYRRYLGTKEISRRFGANPVVRGSVRRYFAARGAGVRMDPSGAFATVRLAPGAVRSVFGVTAGAAARGKVEPRVPAGLEGVVTEVAVPAAGPEPEPAISRARPAQSAPTELPPGISTSRTGTPRGCPAGQNAKAMATLPTGGFTPNQIAAAHGLGALHERGIEGQGRRIALIEFDGGFNPADMTAFAACFGLPKPKLKVWPVDGPVPMPATLEDSDEVTLDVQVLMGMAPRAAIDVYEASAEASFAQAFAAVLAPRKGHRLPDAISASFGECEAALTDLGSRSQRRLDRYMTLVAAAAGVPILVSADDQGSSACSTAGIPALDKLALVDYPAGQKFVTAVGGTSFTLRRDNSILSQRVWNDTVLGSLLSHYGGGGGGTSRLIGRPYYQSQAGIRGGKGRQVPDLAFYADLVPGWTINCTAAPCQGAGWFSVGGTSAATPLFAAGLALVNQDGAKRGLPPIGFVNPLLYRLARGASSPFRDIVLGDNDIYGTGCCSARKGYDRASGWGSLDMAKFARVAHEAYRRR